MTTDQYELYYSTGGHGGPYHGYEFAINAAKRLMFHDTSKTMNIIEVRPRNSLAIGGYSDHNHGSTYVKINRENDQYEVNYR